MNSNTLNNHIEYFFYYQDKNHATVLEVDYVKKIVKKIVDYPPIECANMQFISIDTVNVLLIGFHKSFFIVVETKHSSNYIDDKTKRKFEFFDRINKKVQAPSYYKIIEEEYRLCDAFAEKRKKYDDIVEKHNESIRKIDLAQFAKEMEKYSPDENMPEHERIKWIAEVMKNGDTNGFNEFMKKLKSNKEYYESNEISKKIEPAFYELLKAFVDLQKHFSKEYELYSEKYKNKIDEYADKGLFLYCLNTPDLPLEDDAVLIDDIYDYYLSDNAMYLEATFDTFTENICMSEINRREADDLIASFNLLNEGKYWASLRNLYALIDHHHKLCSDIFNGYYEEKRKFKNGKQRSKYIEELFEMAKIQYYEKVWDKINEAIEEINTGNGKRFVSRNAIVHGDYEKLEINPNAHDVVNIFLLYVTMRQIIDSLANFENIIKEFNIYAEGYVLGLNK